MEGMRTEHMKEKRQSWVLLNGKTNPYHPCWEAGLLLYLLIKICTAKSQTYRSLQRSLRLSHLISSFLKPSPWLPECTLCMGR